MWHQGARLRVCKKLQAFWNLVVCGVTHASGQGMPRERNKGGATGGAFSTQDCYLVSESLVTNGGTTAGHQQG